MLNDSLFAATPYGASLLLPDADQRLFFDAYVAMPPKLRSFLGADETGRSIRKLLGWYDVPAGRAPGIAVAIFYAVAVNDFPQLPATLAFVLSLSQKKARELAHEVETELLAPVKAELEDYWKFISEEGEKTTSRSARAGRRRGASANVLDLKKDRKFPLPPPIPKR